LGVWTLLQSAAEGFYFELEAFLDDWRRQGVPEIVVRATLERAGRASLAMESVGERLKDVDRSRTPLE